MRSTRAVIAGFGTTGSLVAAAACAFLVASAVIAFKGWPGAGFGDAFDTVFVNDSPAVAWNVPGTAAVAAGAGVAADAVSATAVGPTFGEPGVLLGTDGTTVRAVPTPGGGVVVVGPDGTPVGGAGPLPGAGGGGGGAGPGVPGVPGLGTGGVTNGVADTVTSVTGGVGDTVTNTTGGAGDAVGGVSPELGGAVRDTGRAVGDAVGNTGAGDALRGGQ